MILASFKPLKCRFCTFTLSLHGAAQNLKLTVLFIRIWHVRFHSWVRCQQRLNQLDQKKTWPVSVFGTSFHLNESPYCNTESSSFRFVFHKVWRTLSAQCLKDVWQPETCCIIGSVGFTVFRRSWIGLRLEEFRRLFSLHNVGGLTELLFTLPFLAAQTDGPHCISNSAQKEGCSQTVAETPRPIQVLHCLFKGKSNTLELWLCFILDFSG